MNCGGVVLLILMVLSFPGAHAAAAAPAAFSLQAPLNRSASESTTPALSWGHSSPDAAYTLEIATDTAFGATTVVTKSGLATTAYTLPAPLSPGVIYFWRVTATNAGGSLAAENGPFEFSAPIAIGSGSPGSLAVTPDGARVLVAGGDSTSGYLADVSVAGHSVIQAIPVGISPAGVAIRADGQEAVVASSIGHSVSVINLANDAVKATIGVPCAGTTLYDLAYTADGARIVLPDLSNGCTVEGLRLITIASQAQTFVTISGAGQGIAVMPNGDSALSTRGILGTTVRRMNLANSAVMAINNTSSSFGIAVTPDSSQAVVASGEGDTIKRINLSTNTVVGATPFASNQSFHNVAITPDGSQAVVVGDFTSALISLQTDGVVRLYPDGGSNVAIAPDGGHAYISAYASGNQVLLKVIRITGSSATMNFDAGWNLAGNSVQAPLAVAASFGDATKLASVWKWVATGTAAGVFYPNWAYYSPALSDGGRAYAESKGYEFLTTINAGEGFWVHANTGFTAQLPVGTAVTSSSFQNLSSGWHLIATGTTQSPGSFNNDLSAAPASAGTLPLNIRSLWAWDIAQSKWYFYAPGLEAKGGTALADYIAGRGYLNFTTANKTLGSGIGFWVYKP